MTYGIRLPDGTTVGFDDSVPMEQAQLIVRKNFPEAFAKKQGLGAEVSAGLEDLLSGAKTALTAPFSPKEVAARSLLERQARAAEMPETGTFEDVKKAYEQYGLVGGLGELTEQASRGVARQLPQIGATIGSTAAGARLGAAAGLPGIIGGGLAGFTSSFLPIAGQNIVRQAEEQEKAGQEIDPSLLSAYGTAAPAAALEFGSLGFGLGKRIVSKVLGQTEKEIAEGLAKNAVKYEADLVNAAQAKLFPTIAGGAARGLVEIPTEVAQQILERAQAGLDLFSPDAISEYGSAAYQAGLVGPVIGGAAGPLNRSQARGELEELRAQRRAVEQQTKIAEEEQYRASPEYISELTGQRSKLQEEMELLKPIISTKPQSDEDKQIQREAKARMRELKLEMQDVVTQLRDVAPETKGLPETLEQRIWRERIAKQTAPIAQEREMVTDEFGNIVPGVTKEMALEGRALSSKDKTAADNAMASLKKLLEAEKKRQLTAAEKARKQELTDNLEATTSSAQLWRDLGLADQAEGVARSKGLEQILRSSGKPITEQERVKYEKNIDSGYMNRDLKGFMGLSGKSELGEGVHDLKVREDAREVLPVLEERLDQLRRAKNEVVNKELVGKDGQPTKFFNMAIANEVAYNEITRLANIAKKTLAETKDSDIVDAAFTKAKQARPQTLNLVDKNLAPAAYEKIVNEQLEAQQEAIDDLRISLDDIAEGEFLGGRRRTVKYDKDGNPVGEEAKELKARYDALAPDFKEVYPTFDDFYTAKASTAAATKENLQARAEQAKDTYIDASIKQAEAYRLSKGLDPLTEGEVAEATRQMQELLDEAIVRGQLTEDQFANVQQYSLKPKYEEITMPAQMRAGKIARPAYTYKKLVGYEGLSDEAKSRQTDLLLQDIFGKDSTPERGFTSREAALGSIGFDYGPRLPANMVKQMRAAGVGARAVGRPSERVTPGTAEKLEGVVENRGYVQDKLAQIKVGLMQRRKQAGEGEVKRVPKEKETLFLTKTGEKAAPETDVKRTTRILEDARNIGRALEKQRGLPRDIGRTLTRAADFISAQVQAGKDADTTQLDNVLDLVEEQVTRVKRGQDATRKFNAETNEDLNQLLDRYEGEAEGQRELFPSAKKQANKQLAKLKEEQAGLDEKDLSTLKDRLDVAQRIKETEQWLGEFTGPSGMGRKQLASFLRRPANQLLADKIEQQRKETADALAKEQEVKVAMEMRMAYVKQLEFWKDYLSDLRSYYKYAYIPNQPVPPAKDPRFNTVLPFSEGYQEAFAAYEALDKLYKEKGSAPYEGDENPMSQEERKQEYTILAQKARKNIKFIKQILAPTKVTVTKDSLRDEILKDTTAELEEIYKTRYAHHEAVLESIKNAPERYEHFLKMMAAAEAQVNYYENVSTEFLASGAMQEEMRTVEGDIERARNEAQKLFNYAKATAKSIEAEIDKDKVIQKVGNDPEVKRLLRNITSLQNQKAAGKAWVNTALSEESKAERNARVLTNKENQEKVKAANEATAKIAQLNKQYTITKVAKKDLDIIVKERASTAAMDAAQTKIDNLEKEIDALKKVEKPNAQQRKSLDKKQNDLIKAQSNLALAKSAAQQLGAYGRSKAKTTVGVSPKEEAQDRQDTFDEAKLILEDKKKEVQQKIYTANKEKKPKAFVDSLEEQKQTVQFMIDRLNRLGVDGIRGLNMKALRSGKDFADLMRIRAEIKSELSSVKGLTQTLQDYEDEIKVLNERANIAEKQGSDATAEFLRKEAASLQSQLNAERTLLRQGDAPEKIIHKRALRTGHNNFYKTAEQAARAEVGKDKTLSIDQADRLVKARTNEIYNRMLSDFLKDGASNNDVEGTDFRDIPGKSGGVDLDAADALINKMIAKEGFSPGRRAVTAAAGAATLPIKIPSLKGGIEAQIKKLLIANQFADENFDREGAYKALLDGGLTETQINEAMGDMRYEALKRISLINEPVETALKSLPKNLRTKFYDTFSKVLDKEGLDSYDRSYIETVDNYIRENEGSDTAYDVDIGFYLQDPVAYVSNQAEASIQAFRAVGLAPKQGAAQPKEVERARRVQLSSGVNFVYAKTFADAPDAFMRAVAVAGKDPATVRGAVLPDGTVVVIGENHTSIADLEDTIAHEIIGHYAIDTLLGPKGMKALVKKVFENGDEQAFKLAADLGVYDDVMEAKTAAESQGMSKEEMQTLMTREMIAHVAEPSHKRSTTQVVKDFIKNLVAAIRNFFVRSGLDNEAKLSTQDIYNLIRDAKKNYESGQARVYVSPDGKTVFSNPSRYGAEVDQRSIDIFGKLYATKKTLKDKILSNATGLARDVQWFDNLAAWEHLIKNAEQKGMLDSMKALEANWYMRLYGQRIAMTAQAGSVGVPLLEKNSFGELDVTVRKTGANLKRVAEILERADRLGSPEVINRFFQTYLVAKRVKRVGIRALSADLNITKSDLDHVVGMVNSIEGVKDIFDEAAGVYSQYNKDLLDFLVQTGAMTKELAASLTKYDDYVPFYRVKNGIAELVVSGEHAIMIGRMADQPYLHELVGGKEMLVDFEESAFQNTSLLMDMALRNMATSTLAQSMEKVGKDPKHRIAVRVSPKMAGTDIIRAKVNGVDAAWKINTKDTGFDDIPAELLVKGLEGIKTTIPFVFEMMGLPTRFLRNMITRSPSYVVNQIVKDSTAMWMYSGADIKPVVSAIKEYASMAQNRNELEKELQASGVLSGQVFTGMPEDMGKAMLQMMGGKNNWQKVFAFADKTAMKADAATRVAMYRAFLDKGMSPMRAKLAVLEALNTNKRGLSPTMQIMSTLIPFMNTQVQGLNVLAKAFTGKLTLGEQKDLRKKMFRRGALLSAMTIVYTATVGDDEAYKNADPFTRYNNWFIKLPFFSEPIKVPAPFEFGYVFKALPEIVFNKIQGKDAQAMDFIKQAAINSTPFGLPQAIKPAIEAYTGVSFYTGKSIESALEKKMLPGFRERPQTTELARIMGRVAPETVSPVMLESLARGYGGGLTIALASVLNPFLAPTSNVASPEKRPSQLPFIGGFFQPADGPGMLNAAYETALRAEQAANSFKKLVENGKKDEAKAFAEKYSKDIILEEPAGAMVREMGELNKAERAVQAMPNMSPADKLQKLKEIRAAKIKLAEAFNKLSARE
jgi:hypothetical protein